MGKIYTTAFVDLSVTASSAYTSGDALGDLKSVTIPDRGTIVGVVAIDRASQNVDFDVVMFNDSIAGTTDNAAFDPTDAELLFFVGTVTVTGYKAFNDNSVATVANVQLPYSVDGNAMIFQCVTRGTPTYVATDDVQVAFLIEY